MKTFVLQCRIFWGAATGLGLIANTAAAPVTNTEPATSAPPQALVQPTNSSQGTIPPAPEAADKGQAREARAQAPATFQIAEIVKMTESGVDSATIKAYVEQSATVYPPNADEVIYLHQHGVSSDLIAAFIRRGAELNTQRARGPSLNQTMPTAAIAPASVSVQTPAYVYPAQPVQPVYAYSYPNYVYVDYPTYSYSWPSIWFSSWHYPRTWYTYGYPRHVGGFAHGYPGYTVRGSYGGRNGGVAHAPFAYGAGRGLSGRPVGAVQRPPNPGIRGGVGGRIGGVAHAPFAYSARGGFSGGASSVVRGSPGSGARGGPGGRAGPGPSRGRP